MKWTHGFCWLAIALAGMASAGEFDQGAPPAPTLPGAPAPIFDNDTYAGVPVVQHDAHAAQGQAHHAAGHGQHGVGDCKHCNGLGQCCEFERTCCDNVWDDYCAEKVDWCNRYRRRPLQSLFSRCPSCGRGSRCNACNHGGAGDACDCCVSQGRRTGRMRGMMQGRRCGKCQGRGCADCGDMGCGDGAAVIAGCASCGDAHYHPAPHGAAGGHHPTPAPVPPQPDFTTPPPAPPVDAEPPMIDDVPEAPRSARRGRASLEDAFQNMLRWNQR